jgi:hypothetical protein
MKIKRCLVVFVVLGALGPGVDWAQAIVASGSRSAQQSRAHRTVPAARREQQTPTKRKSGTARLQVPLPALKPSHQVGNTRGSAVTATPNADSAAAHSLAPAPLAISKPPFGAGATPSKQAMTTPHFNPRYSPTGNHSAGLSGGAGRGRPSAPVVVGGPARYDARNGAVIDGTAMRRKPF